MSEGSDTNYCSSYFGPVEDLQANHTVPCCKGDEAEKDIEKGHLWRGL